MSRRNIIRAIVGLAAASALAVGVVQLSKGEDAASANFSAAAPVTVHADAGTLKLKADGPLNFTKMVPSTTAHPRVYSSQVTFTNTGNVKGDKLTVGLPVSITEWTVPAGQNPDWNQVYVTVPGYLDTPTKVTSLGSNPEINLGALDAGVGHAKVVTVNLELRSAGNTPAGNAKDNQFQGVSLTATATGQVLTD